MRVEEGIPHRHNHDPYHDRVPYQRRHRRHPLYLYPRTKIGVPVAFSGVGKGTRRRKKRSTAGVLVEEASADEDDDEDDDYGPISYTNSLSACCLVISRRIDVLLV